MVIKLFKSLKALIIIAMPFLLSGCNWVLFNSKGEVGVQQSNLIITAILLMLIVVIPAILMTFLFAWRYRAGNKKATYTPDWAHSNKIELVVWGVPMIIIAILAAIVWVSTHKLDPYKPLISSKPALTVEVIATDWKWVFIYPEQKVATVNELVFPADRPVSFQITSDSTMNTFFIPQLGGQIYAMAGMRTQLNLKANEIGNYDGMSGNFSGQGFSDMKFIAHATSEENFDKWIDNVRSKNSSLDFAGFKKLAEPSQKHPIEYFSSVQDGVFQQVIDQFMDSGMDMHAKDEQHSGMDMTSAQTTMSHSGE
ncbi:ubiquinol oxidase subunit II [Pantoea sp. App145]|uniref:ubiquinol oxidase subunit II n=1 Tax=Pantoea sp. App145 TaxID=3071567 RepID=UPI003A8035D7